MSRRLRKFLDRRRWGLWLWRGRRRMRLRLGGRERPNRLSGGSCQLWSGFVNAIAMRTGLRSALIDEISAGNGLTMVCSPHCPI